MNRGSYDPTIKAGNMIKTFFLALAITFFLLFLGADVFSVVFGLIGGIIGLVVGLFGAAIGIVVALIAAFIGLIGIFLPLLILCLIIGGLIKLLTPI